MERENRGEGNEDTLSEDPAVDSHDTDSEGEMSGNGGDLETAQYLERLDDQIQHSEVWY